MKLSKINKIMGIVNKSVDEIHNKLKEFDTKRLHDSNANLIYQGLRFSYIQICELQGDLEEELLKD